MKKVFVLILLALPAFLNAQTWFEKGQKTEDDLLKVEYFTKALESEKKDNWTYYYRGYALHRLGHYERAVSDFRAAEKAAGDLDPSYIHSAMAWSYYFLDDIAQGITNGEKALQERAGNTDACNVLGWLYMTQKNYPKAIQVWEKYATLQPRSPYPFSNLSYAYLLNHEYQKVVDNCDKALEIEPQNDYLVERKALALMKLGKQEAGMALLKDKLEFKQDDPLSLSNLGNLYYRSQDYMTAIEMHSAGISLYEKKIAQDPKFIKVYRDDVYDIYLARGDAWYALKEYQKAMQDYTHATTIKPEDYRAWYELGELQTFQKNYIEGTKGYEKAYSLAPDLRDGWVNLGFCYDNLNQSRKAIDAYTRGLSRDPENGLLWNNRGYAYLLLKEYDKARADLEKAIQVEPAEVMSHVSLGEYFYFTGDYPAAIRKFDEAIHMPDGSSSAYFTAYFTRGLSWLAQKKYEEAERDFLQALDWDAADPRAWEHLGVAQYELQKLCPAYTHLKRALEIDSRNRVKECTVAMQYLAKITRNPCPN